MKLRIWSVSFLILFVTGMSVAQDFRIIHGPYLQAVGQNEATIVWVTNKKAVSWVELADEGIDHFYAKERKQYYELREGRRHSGTFHSVRLTNLKAGATYRYRVVSREIITHEGYKLLFGSTQSTDVFMKAPLRFTTLNPDKPEIVFRIVNDIHNNSNLLHSLLGDVTRSNSDFLIYNGDMVSTVDSQQTFFDGFVDASVKLFAGEIPFFYARGNHETRGSYGNEMLRHFPSPSSKPYYTFRHGPVYFVVLDSGEDKPDSDIAYFGMNCFDDYRSEQAAWLQHVVASEEYKRAPFKVVIVHIPPLGSDWHGSFEVKNKFLPVLNEAGADVMFCAHLHSYKFHPVNPQSENRFPIIVNDNETYLEVSASASEIIISQKNGNREIINKHTIKKP